MRTWLLLLVVVVAACGPTTGQGALPLPTPPTAVLAAWKDFPAHADPRPIIAFGDTVEHIQPAGFPDGDRKLAWMCNRFVFASGVTVSEATPASTSGLATISSARAYSELIKARSANSDSVCGSYTPFVISAVRWSLAGFPTDRGTMQLPAWVFDVPEVGAYIGYLGIDPSALWGGGLSAHGRDAEVSFDGMRLRMPVANPGQAPCESDYTAAAAESDTAVAIAVRAFPHEPGPGAGCSLILRTGYVTVALHSPLDGRVVLDEQGNLGAVCPESRGC